MTIQESIDAVKDLVPKEIPADLQSACKCEPLDPAWPIGGPLDALKFLMAWERYDNQEIHPCSDISHRITHSHHYEYADLIKYGVEEVYKKSLATKYVSIGWHLAGRYNMDNGLIGELDRIGWPKLKFLDFGAAPWIQSIFYRQKGLSVTTVNQTLDSDCHRFGRFMACCLGITDIKEFASDAIWDKAQYDVVYCVDVLEHIPPLEDGAPGWVPLAERLLSCWKKGGVGYLNAPFGLEGGAIKPVESHPVHYTSPFSLEGWLDAHGVKQEGYFWRKVQ